MAYCWIKRRGKVYYLHFAGGVGRKPYSLNTRDRALAKEAQRRIESEVWCNERGIKRRTAARIRYSDLARRFTDAKKAAGVNPKTLTNYIKTLNRFGTFLQSDLFIDAITPEHVEAFIRLRRNSVRERDKKPVKAGTVAPAPSLLKPKSIRNEVFTLICLFKFAVERDLVLEDITKKVSKPHRVTYDAPRALTFDEYLKLKGAITNEKFSDIVDLYLLTGIRRSDGLNITSENFDLKQMVATLPQHKQGTHKTIPIGADLAVVVKRMIGRVGEGKPLVQLHPSRLTDNFRAARKRAELPPSLTFHSLRHTFGSWLAALGTDFKTIQELIGHRSDEATRLYVHAFDPNKRTAIEKLMLPRKAANA